MSEKTKNKNQTAKQEDKAGTIQFQKISADQIPAKRNNKTGIYAQIEEQLKTLRDGEALVFQVERPGQAAGIAWHFRKVAETTTRTIKDQQGNIIGVKVYMTKKKPA